jgi:PAS domain S-box-containing protein
MRRLFPWLRISSRVRICIGLTSIVSSTLILAIIFGMMPDVRLAKLEGRSRLCEAIAVNSSLRVTRQDLLGLKTVLEVLKYRHPEVLSAGVRKSTGELLIEVPPLGHAPYWEHIDGDRSVDTHVQVPILAGTEKWGTVELRFVPVHPPGWYGFYMMPTTRLIMFTTTISFGVFYLYLRRMLRQVDPSQAVPGRVRSALDTLTEGLLVLDRQGRIVLANHAFSTLVGETSGALLGRKASEFRWLSMDEQPYSGDMPWVTALRTHDTQANIMMKLRHSSFGVRTFGVNCSPVLGHDGKYRGVLASFDDVTELENQKVELHRSKLAAEEANHAKSAFLANMSHEIRTPMNAILGFTDVLRRGLVNSEAEVQRYLTTIHTSGEHLLGLINDILDLSKVEAGRLDVEQIACQPAQLCREVVTVLAVRATDKGITLDFRIDGRVPESILSDSTRLRQILTNLTGNALKFTEQGGVLITLAWRETDGGTWLDFAVRDSGVGISASALEHIFEPFTQADNSVTRKFGGTGLGLTISRGFARAMGGDITVTSLPGEGSTFTARIACTPAEGTRWIGQADLEAAAEQTVAKARAQSRLPKFRDATVLLVDDGEANRQLIHLVLTRSGLTVIEAANGQIAVDHAAETEFDLVLMDMQMPVMDGYTATGILRQRGYTRPIVALTGNAMKGDEDKCLAAGCSHFLSKPVKIDELMQLLVSELGAVEQTDDDDSSLANLAALCQQVDDELSSPSSDQGELVCSLPLDDPDFLRIATNFIGKLEKHLVDMRAQLEQEDWAELANSAHWLKGAGGTVGFNDFTEPARQLELTTRLRQPERAAQYIRQIEYLLRRVRLPEPEPVA